MCHYVLKLHSDIVIQPPFSGKGMHLIPLGAVDLALTTPILLLGVLCLC